MQIFFYLPARSFVRDEGMPHPWRQGAASECEGANAHVRDADTAQEVEGWRPRYNARDRMVAMQVNGSAGTRKTRVLIFVVAYEAESTLEGVLARVPDSIFEHDTEVLVIDDSSVTGPST